MNHPDQTEDLLREVLAERASIPPAAPDEFHSVRDRGRRRRRNRIALATGGALATAVVAVALLSPVLRGDDGSVDVRLTPATAPTTPVPDATTSTSLPREEPAPSQPTPTSSDTTEQPAPDPSGQATPSSDPAQPAPSEPTPSAPDPAVACGDIAFTPESDDMASGITSTGLPCDQALDLVRTVRSQHNFVSGPRSFQAAGYSCTVVTDTDALPVGHYTCRAGDAEVTWDKT